MSNRALSRCLESFGVSFNAWLVQVDAEEACWCRGRTGACEIVRDAARSRPGEYGLAAARVRARCRREPRWVRTGRCRSTCDWRSTRTHTGSSSQMNASWRVTVRCCSTSSDETLRACPSSLGIAWGRGPRRSAPHACSDGDRSRKAYSTAARRGIAPRLDRHVACSPPSAMWGSQKKSASEHAPRLADCSHCIASTYALSSKSGGRKSPRRERERQYRPPPQTRSRGVTWLCDSTRPDQNALARRQRRSLDPR